jgi:hypothetical protein
MREFMRASALLSEVPVIQEVRTAILTLSLAAQSQIVSDTKAEVRFFQ